VALQIIVFGFLAIALGSASAYVVLRRRHRCPHNSPLCRRDRPCIACYREMFQSREAEAGSERQH